jgi:hypothetical protein
LLVVTPQWHATLFGEEETVPRAPHRVGSETASTAGMLNCASLPDRSTELSACSWLVSLTGSSNSRHSNVAAANLSRLIDVYLVTASPAGLAQSILMFTTLAIELHLVVSAEMSRAKSCADPGRASVPTSASIWSTHSD